MAEDQGKEQEKFDFTSDGEGYISLDEARVLAMRTAVESPGDYGSTYQGIAMFFEVSSLEETEDFYEVTLSFRPQGNFEGTPGQEQFVVGKEGVISIRQVQSFPAQTSASPADTPRKSGGSPLLPVAIGVVVVGAIAVVGAVLAFGNSGGASVPVAVVAPTETRAPTESPISPMPTYTPQPTYTPVPALIPNPTPYPTSTYVPTPLPIATRYPTPTPHPTSTPKPPSGLVFVSQFGDGIHGVKNGQLINPTNVSVASDGSVYIADSNNPRIQKFTSDGVFVTTWGNLGSGDGQFNYPKSIAAASDGSVYVADRNHNIQKFTSNGMFVTKWGTYGTGDGQFKGPSDVAVASDGSVYVADTGNNRIQKFTSEGVFVTKWGDKGKKFYMSDGQFLMITGIAVASDGSVYVSDRDNHNIQKFTSEGVFVARWGTVDEFLPTWGTSGSGDGQFNSPVGVTVAPDGSVYVSNSGDDRIQKFTSEGVFVTKWNSVGENLEVEVAPDGSVYFYAADKRNFRVQKFSVVQ